MCCERLQESAINVISVLKADNPNRQELSKVAIDIVINCPKTSRSHTSKIAGTPLPPESEAIPRFFRNNPEATDLLLETGALDSLLR